MNSTHSVSVPAEGDLLKVGNYTITITVVDEVGVYAEKPLRLTLMVVTKDGE